MSLKIGTGGNALRSFLLDGVRFAGETGAGTALGPWHSEATLKIRKQIRRTEDFAEYPDMYGLNIDNFFPRSKSSSRHPSITQRHNPSAHNEVLGTSMAAFVWNQSGDSKTYRV